MTLAVLTLLFVSATAPSAREEARPRDLQRLQEDLANLDEALRDLEGAGAEALRARAEEIREETVYLKVKMRRHQRSGAAGTGVELSEVDDLRERVAELRADLEDSRLRDAAEVRILAGTELLVRLDEPLSSRTARVEDRFDVWVERPVRAASVVAIPAGTRVRGVVRAAMAAERPSRGGRLELEFDALYLGRERLPIRGRVTALPDANEAKVDAAGRAGIGAVLGSVLGGILGGRKGAAVGILVGGAGAVVAGKGEEAELAAGTLLTVQLEKDLVVPRDALRSRDDRDAPQHPRP